jgi:hypothetical protein
VSSLGTLLNFDIKWYNALMNKADEQFKDTRTMMDVKEEIMSALTTYQN